MYKYTRKEVSTGIHSRIWENCSKDDLIEILYQTNFDLLAQKEDSQSPSYSKHCTNKGAISPSSTPSPLEIEEISEGDMRCLEDTRLIDKLWEKQCQIIRNQKKLYQYIKSLKEKK